MTCDCCGHERSSHFANPPAMSASSYPVWMRRCSVGNYDEQGRFSGAGCECMKFKREAS